MIVRNLGPVQLGDGGAHDAAADVVGLLRRGRTAGADRPDRLVGDDQALDLRGIEAGQRAAHLAADKGLRLARLVLFQRLAAADDRGQARLRGQP